MDLIKSIWDRDSFNEQLQTEEPFIYKLFDELELSEKYDKFVMDMEQRYSSRRKQKLMSSDNISPSQNQRAEDVSEQLMQSQSQQQQQQQQQPLLSAEEESRDSSSKKCSLEFEEDFENLNRKRDIRRRFRYRAKKNQRFTRLGRVEDDRYLDNNPLERGKSHGVSESDCSYSDASYDQDDNEENPDSSSRYHQTHSKSISFSKQSTESELSDSKQNILELLDRDEEEFQQTRKLKMDQATKKNQSPPASVPSEENFIICYVQNERGDLIPLKIPQSKILLPFMMNNNQRRFDQDDNRTESNERDKPFHPLIK